MDVVAAAQALADDVLRPAAEEVDRAGVPRSHVHALARAGVLGLNAPVDVGGLAAPAPVVRQVNEILAGADCSTWFVSTQHHRPVTTLARSRNDALRSRWLPALATGRSLAGVAYTHLRRPGPPPVRAEPLDAGWRLSGEIAWLTSWGLADGFLIGAQAGGDVVWVFLAPAARPGVSVQPLDLMAMGGTHTVRVHLDGVVVDAGDVVVVDPIEQWRAADAARTADTSPAVFGVTAEVVRRLREHATGRGDAAAADLADALDDELRDVRVAAYALVDEVPAGERLQERISLRAAAHALACRATAGLVATGAGRSMTRDAAAQRLAREALFLLVQGQTAVVRAATVRRFAGR